jgi:hypothetical protein
MRIFYVEKKKKTQRAAPYTNHLTSHKFKTQESPWKCWKEKEQ